MAAFQNVYIKGGKKKKYLLVHSSTDVCVCEAVALAEVNAFPAGRHCIGTGWRVSEYLFFKFC